MSWQQSDENSERIKFVGDWLKDEFDFSYLCERYGISRKTGYKLINRYKVEGEDAFKAKSHCRHYHPNKTDAAIEARLLELKYRYPYWGPRKLRSWLLNEAPDEAWPAASTIGELLKRHHLVNARRYRKRTPGYSEPFGSCLAANDIWSADFKGQFRMGNKDYCYPLTVTDNYSRYLLLCKGLERPTLEATRKGFEHLFREYGLPKAIRTDNGQPFASVGIGGLTRLSVWFLKLGILPERIEPGCPQQNGRHERMHRTLKQETTKPSGKDLPSQQSQFDRFRSIYNDERPHEALDGRRPAEIYTGSERVYPSKISEIVYPDAFAIRKIKTNGNMKWQGKQYYISESLVHEPVGLEVIDDGRAILHFAGLKLGLVDARTDRIIRI
ncbi:MAG: integrase core domain-containing protein [Gammaproteobacteria bacterium]|nr:integrase core domain-containing protein [Gammaproteobacteria bacterium]